MTVEQQCLFIDLSIMSDAWKEAQGDSPVIGSLC